MSKRSRIQTDLSRVEALESRLVLSGPADVTGLGGAVETLGVLSVDPADGSVTTMAPRVLTVEFDREIDAFSVGLNDLRLERLDEGGLVVWSTEMEGLFLESTLDEAGLRLAMALPDDLMLEPGGYRVVLSGWSLLGGVDGTPAVEPGIDRILSSFVLSLRGATLDEAEDLGDLVPGMIHDRDGFLDFVADPRAVRLFRFQVPEGPATWRLGVAVVAQAHGSPLDAALSLFDASGRVLAATDKGLRDAPEDPFLYAALQPGVYYVGVSGVGNLAGRPGAYDPANGLPELVSVARESGPFQLSLVIDPADEPARLIGLSVQSADRFDPTPTGIELRFSSLVFPTPRDDDGPLVGIRLVGADGRGWPLAGAEFDVERATLRYAIIDRLPPGRYSIVLGNRFPLIDLAGNRPVAPGQPAGVLGTFEVVGRRPAHEATDLGVAFLRDLGRGVARSIDLRAGESYVYRLVLTRRDLLRLQVRHAGGAGRIEVVRDQGDTVVIDLEARSQPRETTRLLNLMPGEVWLRVTATGSDLFSLRWNLTNVAADNERLLLNGNGHGPALGLRLIAPSGAVTTPTPPSLLGSISDRPAFDPIAEAAATSMPTGSVSVPIVVTPIVLPMGPGSPGGESRALNPSLLVSAPTETGAPSAQPAVVMKPIAPSSRPLLVPTASLVGRPMAGTQRNRLDGPGTARSERLAARAPADASFSQTGQDVAGDPGGVNPLAPPVDLPAAVQPAPAVAEKSGQVEPPTEVAQAPGEPEPVASGDEVLGERLAIGQATLATAPATADPAGAPSVVPATLDPFGWTRRGLGDGSDPHSLKSDLSSPFGAMVLAAAVVEGHRRLRRWLGRRQGLRRAVRVGRDWWPERA